jgi:hypothetical protein
MGRVRSLRPTAFWLDPPPEDSDGRHFLPDACASACWLGGGARLIWAASGRVFGADGSGHGSDALVVADGASLEVQRVLPAPGLTRCDWAVSPDERKLAAARGYYDEGGEFRPASGYQDCGLDVWDLPSGVLVNIALDAFLPSHVGFVSDHEVLVLGIEGHSPYTSAEMRDTARSIDLWTGEVRSVPLPEEAPRDGKPVWLQHGPALAHPSGDGSVVLERAQDRPVALVRLDPSGQERARYSLVAGPSGELAFAPGGARLALEAPLGHTRVWDLASRRVVEEHTGGLLGYTSDGELLLQAQGEAWRAPDRGAVVARATRPLRMLDGLLLVPDGERCQLLHSSGESVALPIPAWRVWAVSWPARTVVASVAEGHAFELVTSERRVRVPLPDAQLPGGFCFSPDGETLWGYVPRGYRLGRWRVHDGAPLGQLPLPGAGYGSAQVAFWAGRNVVAVSYSAAVGMLALFDPGSGELWARVAGDGLPWAFSDDGQHFAIRMPGGRALIRKLPR